MVGSKANHEIITKLDSTQQAVIDTYSSAFLVIYGSAKTLIFTVKKGSKFNQFIFDPTAPKL